MKLAACCDPLELPCSDREIQERVVAWPAGQSPPQLQPKQQLEIHGPPPFLTLEQPWSLWLEGLEDFDLGYFEAVVEQAALAGCRLIVAAPLSATQPYRYRLYSLLRLLCDMRKLRFAIFEADPLDKADRLNVYLASQKRCCRRLQP